MIVYRDQAFCKSDCTNTDCHRNLTDSVKKGAIDLKLPLSLMDFSKNCNQYIKPKENDMEKSSYDIVTPPEFKTDEEEMQYNLVYDRKVKAETRRIMSDNDELLTLLSDNPDLLDPLKTLFNHLDMFILVESVKTMPVSWLLNTTEDAVKVFTTIKHYAKAKAEDSLIDMSDWESVNIGEIV